MNKEDILDLLNSKESLNPTLNKIIQGAHENKKKGKLNILFDKDAFAQFFANNKANGTLLDSKLMFNSCKKYFNGIKDSKVPEKIKDSIIQVFPDYINKDKDLKIKLREDNFVNSKRVYAKEKANKFIERKFNELKNR